MIDNEQIKKLVTHFQTSELNVCREYLQHLFLAYFYRQINSENVFFKGGTAFKIIYKSPRFSEDLDFSVNFRGSEEIEQIILQTLWAIEKEGLIFDLTESKPTSGGYLAKINFKVFNQKIDLMLQFSLRAFNKKGETKAITNEYIPIYNLTQLSEDQMVGEKIAALLTRKKPRDFYDLYFILRSDLLPTKQRKVLVQVLETFKKTRINFERELKQFLPKSHWMIIKDFRKTFEREIKHFL